MKMFKLSFSLMKYVCHLCLPIVGAKALSTVHRKTEKADEKGKILILNNDNTKDVEVI
jgi:hypothetical protein